MDCRQLRTQQPDAALAPDLVKRDFSATAPNRLWLTDLRHVGGRADMAYVCSIADAFSRMITGWRIAVRLGTDMVLDALEITRCQDVPVVGSASSPTPTPDRS